MYIYTTAFYQTEESYEASINWTQKARTKLKSWRQGSFGPMDVKYYHVKQQEHSKKIPKNYIFAARKCIRYACTIIEMMARQLRWLERMIHNHEVGSSSLPLATKRKPFRRSLEGFLFSRPSRTCSCKGLEIKRPL